MYLLFLSRGISWSLGKLLLLNYPIPPTNSPSLSLLLFLLLYPPPYQTLHSISLVSLLHSVTSLSNTFSSGLTPGTQYIISVSVDGGCGLGEAVANTTHTLESPPGQPVVTIATVSNSSVALQLSEPIQPNGHIIGFMVSELITQGLPP